MRNRETETTRYADRLLDWTMQAGIRLIRGVEWVIGRASLVGTDPFLDSDTFEWIPGFEGNWEAVRAELDELLLRHDELPNFQDISVDQASITDDDRWKTYFFYAYGVRSGGNCRRCPTTARIVEEIPGMTTAFFSILSPHKHIPEHRGPYRGVLRYHLGLRVPEPTEASGIKVGGRSAVGGKAEASSSTTPIRTRHGTTATNSESSSSWTSSALCGRPYHGSTGCS